jgi:hypothetical protein
VTTEHIVKIDGWRFNYMFGAGKTRFCSELYSEIRHLDIQVGIMQPKGIKATQGQITCLPYDGLVASNYKQHVNASGRNPCRRPAGLPYLVQEKKWTLPFEVWGYYDLRQQEPSLDTELEWAKQCLPPANITADEDAQAHTAVP